VNSPLDVKGNEKRALYFACVRLMLPSPNACLISVALFPRFAQHLMLFLCRIHREIASRLQIKGRKKSARPPSCVKYCTLTSKICQYHHLPLNRATITAVQMAAPDPEIMDTHSIFICPCFKLWVYIRRYRILRFLLPLL
jgi:hypothetical protein